VRKLLVERFSLAYHKEKKEIAVYGLTVAKGGPKIKPETDPSPGPAFGGAPQRGFKPGREARQDNEYERRGTANIFAAVEPKAGRPLHIRHTGPFRFRVRQSGLRTRLSATPQSEPST
jgi:uncharacterized protein (TIGR03435 family)